MMCYDVFIFALVTGVCVVRAGSMAVLVWF